MESRRGRPTAQRSSRIEREVVECRRCPRLVAWREQVAREKVARFRTRRTGAGRCPGFGDPDARILLLGLAPAAHGGNRTGRVFTGDASGEFLWPALHAAGLANRPVSVRAGDGLEAIDLWVTAPVKCAPPDNKPLPSERDRCAPYLVRELAALDRRPRHRRARFVRLGRGAAHVRRARRADRRTRSRVSATEPRRGSGRGRCSGCYHVSQQNTRTGRLTRPMLDEVLARAVQLVAGIPGA